MPVFAVKAFVAAASASNHFDPFVVDVGLMPDSGLVAVVALVLAPVANLPAVFVVAAVSINRVEVACAFTVIPVAVTVEFIENYMKTNEKLLVNANQDYSANQQSFV